MGKIISDRASTQARAAIESVVTFCRYCRTPSSREVREFVALARMQSYLLWSSMIT